MKVYRRLFPYSGFTLIELLVVISMIAVLLAILSPSLMQAKSLAKRMRCAHNLRQVYMAMQMYLDNHDQTYICADDPISTQPFYWLWMGRGWRSYLEPYFQTTIDVNNPSVLLCPADRTDPAKYESTSYSYSLSFYHSPAQINTMTQAQDTYTNARPSKPQKSLHVTFPSAKILFGEWQSHHDPIDNDTGWWTWGGTRLFVLVDGQIRYLKATDIKAANDKLPDANLTVNGIKGQDL